MVITEKKLFSIVRCYGPVGNSSQEQYEWIEKNLANIIEEAIQIRGKNWLLHKISEWEAARMDFRNIFLEGGDELVLVMLSKLLSGRIDASLIDKAKETADAATRHEMTDSAFQEFDSLAKILNHVFDQFCVNVRITRNGIVPRQDDRITGEIRGPVPEVQSDPKWRLVSDNLSGMFEDYLEQNCPEVIAKAQHPAGISASPPG